MLRAWSDAPAFILSCPGPLRRQHAALTPISQLSLPQTLLGAEAQLRAFLACVPEITPRCHFAPLPEMFFTPASLAPLRALYDDPVVRAGAPGMARERLPVHLRFGATRSVRLMKEAVNGVVLAEDHSAPPVTASRHPFASGLVLPAAVRRLFLLDEAMTLPAPISRQEVPRIAVPADHIGADLDLAAAAEEPEFVSFADFRSASFAAGPIRPVSAPRREVVSAPQREAVSAPQREVVSAPRREAVSAPRREAARSRPFVLVPWNLDNPGSAVPALVERVLRLRAAEQDAVRLVIYPFNYPGQTGLIRRLIRRAREAADQGAEVLQSLYVARAASNAAIAGLRHIAPVAWVDGNDPEWRWTLRRLRQAGFSPILLAARAADMTASAAAILADDPVVQSADSRFGELQFSLQMPSLRALRHLLELTRAASPPPTESPRRRGRGGRAAAAAQDAAGAAP